MENKRFQIGDKIIALSDSVSASSQIRKKGKIYEVTGIQYCSSCGIQTINIDFQKNIFLGTYTQERCFYCKGISKPSEMGLTISREFAKIDDINQELEKAVENEDYELASLLRDLKLEKEYV